MALAAAFIWDRSDLFNTDNLGTKPRVHINPMVMYLTAQDTQGNLTKLWRTVIFWQQTSSILKQISVIL